MKPLLPLTLAALATAGVLSALAITPDARAWSPSDLPPGWTVSHGTDIAQGSPCPEWYQVNAYENGTLAAVSPRFCLSSPTYQQDFDAFVAAHYTPPPPPPPPATTTTVTDPPPPPPADTTTTATTTATTPTLTPVEQSLSDRISALEAEIVALTDRVARMERAVDAAWLAYQQAIEAGQDPAAAAALARATYLNAINGLGAFAG